MPRSSSRNLSPRAAIHFLALTEPIEPRRLLSVVTVNASQTVRTVNANILGADVAWWDTSLNTSETESMVTAAGLDSFRFPGGSSSDTWHFNVGPTYGGEGTSATMAQFIAAVHGTGIVTMNYGTASPQENAALLAYLNGSTTNTTVIGNGQQWNATSNTWVEVNWQTAGYWASLRAAQPLKVDDGLNFLRLGQAAPFAFHYWEVGNEIYGTWETDEHGQAGDTSLNGGPGAPNDPVTYANFASQFSTLAAKIDPTISIGVVAGGVDTYNDWIGNVLTQCGKLGFTPGFISDHSYMQGPGSESDSFLLNNTVSNPAGQDPNNSLDWAQRAAAYQTVIKNTLGAAAVNKIQLLATEWNSNYGTPGKQMTSLVEGLWVADSLGSLLQTPYSGANFWDLRNGWDTDGNNSSSLYGWREGGDEGILGDSSGPAPSTGTYIAYPQYYAFQLVSQMVHNGDTVVSATSDNALLAAYAVKEASDGDLDLLIINKSPSASATEQFNLSNFLPNGQANVWQYGETQDTAQSLTSNGASSLANSVATFSVTNGSFSYTFPAYSMTVIDLTKDTGPVVSQAAFATQNPVTQQTTGLRAAATAGTGASTLLYTWSTTSSPTGVAKPTFTANGTNAAQITTAKFAAPGAYTFQVKITDTNGLSTTSSVSLTVTPAGFVSRNPGPVHTVPVLTPTPALPSGGGTVISSPVTVVAMPVSSIASSNQTQTVTPENSLIVTPMSAPIITALPADTTVAPTPASTDLAAPAAVSDPPAPAPITSPLPDGALWLNRPRFALFHHW